MISIPTAILTPCGGLSGAGKPATPAGPNNQSGRATPACRTSGVNNSGRSFSSILFFSSPYRNQPTFAFTSRFLVMCLGSGFIPVGAEAVKRMRAPTPLPLSRGGFVSIPLRSPLIRRGGGGVARWVGTLGSPSSSSPLKPSRPPSKKLLPKLHDKKPTPESASPAPTRNLPLRQLRCTGAISRRKHRRCRTGSSAHATIDEAHSIHLCRLVNVTPINQHGTAHAIANLQHIE